MTADNPDDFPYRRVTHTATAVQRRSYWDVAAGLQKVDGLETSDYMKSLAEGYIGGEQSLGEIGQLLQAHYANKSSDEAMIGGAVAGSEQAGSQQAGNQQAGSQQEPRSNQELNREEEADKVSYRITELLDSGAFVFAPSMLDDIHRHLFQDLDAAIYRPGQHKTEPLQKQESILNGDSVLYADPSLLEKSLNYLFSEEADAVYLPDFNQDQLQHFARFIALVWQTHPFWEGNTRAVAVFAELYLRYLGFDADNEPFAQRALYFRNALVRANYRNAQASVMPDTGFLVRFFDNMLNGAHHELHSRDLIVQELYDNPSLLRNVPPAHAIEKTGLE